MDILQLRHFLQLARNKNFRQTSNETFISQPALTRQIQSLEEEIGVPLFHRTTKKVTLTKAGTFLETEVTRFLTQLDKSFLQANRLEKGEAGLISIGHASTAMQSVLPKILVAIKSQLPDLHTNLNELSNRNIIESISNRMIDIGFAPNISLSNEFDYLSIYKENFVLLFPENHWLAKKGLSNVAELASEPFILPPLSLSVGYVETIWRFCRKEGNFEPNVVHESAYTATVLRLVEAGLGIAIEPKSSLLGHNINVKAIELTSDTFFSEMRMVWLKERSTEFERFFSIVKEII